MAAFSLDSPPAGAIFDVDGTLLDNMAFHVEAFNRFMQKRGLPPLTLERRQWMDGKRNSDIFPGLFDRPLTAREVEAMSEEKESMYRRLSMGRLMPLGGLLRLLDTLDARGIPIGLATSAPPANVSHTLGELGLASRFRVITRSDEVAHGKPAPDVFLEAARRLGVAADRSLAFEDAPAGIVAARRAGMTCVGVATSHSPEALSATNPAPHWVVRDYDEFLAGPGAPFLGRRAQTTS